MNRPLRIVFAGTPEFARIHLLSLLNNKHNVVAVYTQPDRPAGRGRKQTASPVKSLAQACQIPVYQPETLKTSEARDDLARLTPDVMVVVAYGLILPAAILSIPAYGCINVHGSLLPSWRGAAPVQRAIMAGDTQTGVTIMQMDEGLDSGDMLRQVISPIEDHDTSATLMDKLAITGSAALNSVLQHLDSGSLSPEKQTESQATYASKIKKQEGHIQWMRSAREISCQIRGLNPWPVAWTTIDETIIRCWEATLPERQNIPAKPGTILNFDKTGLLVACGQGEALCITKIQLPGKRAMAAHELLNSRKNLFATGAVFQ